MNTLTADNYTFRSFKKHLKTSLSEREIKVLDFPEYRKASVIILFLEKNGAPHVLLTRRTDRVSTHKGQISFPGGGFDSTDRDFLDTALRETMEEVGRDEIDEVLEVPFTLFCGDKYSRYDKINFNGMDYEIYYYNYMNNTIWGMTARILTDFGRKICKNMHVSG